MKYIKEKVFEYYKYSASEMKKEWGRRVTAIDEI